MAKRNKRTKNKVKLKLSYSEILLVKLQHFYLLKKTSESDKQIAKSLLAWFKVNKYFTNAQSALGNKLTYISKKPAVSKKHYLYAISNGEQIKLGMSGNVENRLKALQTSNPSVLVLLWKYYAADDAKGAASAEKKLHKACQKHRIRGEWFSYDCMAIVKDFNPNRQVCNTKWEFAKLININSSSKGDFCNFTVSDIRRDRLNKKMKRVWEAKEVNNLYQVEVKKLIGDGHVVLVSYDL